LKVLEIRNKNNIYAYLFYTSNPNDSYYIEINEKATDLPVFFSMFSEKNKYIINSYYSEKFIFERIIPYERQNIGSILRENHMYNYNPIDFYVRSRGISSMDDSNIKIIKAEDIIDNVKERRKHLIKDFVVLKNNKLVIFFINGESKIIDIENNQNKPFLSLFGEEIIFDSKYRFDYDYLYNNGKDFPLTYDDLINYMNDNILNSGDICEKYSISRQYVNKRSDEFIRINNNLYLKNDILVKLKGSY